MGVNVVECSDDEERCNDDVDNIPDLLLLVWREGDVLRDLDGTRAVLDSDHVLGEGVEGKEEDSKGDPGRILVHDSEQHNDEGDGVDSVQDEQDPEAGGHGSAILVVAVGLGSECEESSDERNDNQLTSDEVDSIVLLLLIFKALQVLVLRSDEGSVVGNEQVDDSTDVHEGEGTNGEDLLPEVSSPVGEDVTQEGDHEQDHVEKGDCVHDAKAIFGCGEGSGSENDDQGTHQD